MSNGTMLILPGVSGNFPDEAGKKKSYDDGALHARAALRYANLMGYDGEVLEIAGQLDEQTNTAFDMLSAENAPYTAIYGFSGGGYHTLHILQRLKKDALERLKLVVVLGSPPTYLQLDDAGKAHHPNCETDITGKLSRSETHDCSTFRSDYESGRYAAKYPKANIKWELVYWTNPDDRGHMFGPDWLLAQELKKRAAAH